MDPDYRKLEAKVEEAKKREAEEWATSQLRDFNNKYGTKYKSIDELELTNTAQDLWQNADIDLERALLLTDPNLLDKKQKTSSIKSNRQDSGKKHMTATKGGGASPTGNSNITVTDRDIETFSGIFSRQLSKEEVLEMKRELAGYRKK